MGLWSPRFHLLHREFLVDVVHHRRINCWPHRALSRATALAAEDVVRHVLVAVDADPRFGRLVDGLPMVWLLRRHEPIQTSAMGRSLAPPQPFFLLTGCLQRQAWEVRVGNSIMKL